MRNLKEGRTSQKARTCKAILEATEELLRQGRTPTIDDVAEASGISRATIYRYFPSQEKLINDASLQLAMPDVKTALADPALAEDVEARLDLVLQISHTFMLTNEAILRTALRFVIDNTTAQKVLDEDEVFEDGAEKARYSRRVLWLEAALEPARGRLSDDAIDQLVTALLPYLGVDMIIAMCDIGGRTREEACAATRWAARSLLRTLLAE